MAIIKLKRGIEANRLSYTPLEGELIYITDTKKLYIGDSTTAGGIWLNFTASETLTLLKTVDGIGSGLDGDLINDLEGSQILRNDQDGLVSAELTTNGINFESINNTTNDNSVVDVFVYDTTKDSDGGQWRKRCSKLSWYNEPLNTATRGSTKEFPSVALIVAELDKVTIYDATKSDCPMWMIIPASGWISYNNVNGTTTFHSSCSCKNGNILLGANGTSGGLFNYNFPADISTYTFNDGSLNRQMDGLVNRGIIKTKDISTNKIINRSVNDVTVTVLPNAPIDAETGLPVPTIAVATDGGVSIIHNDGRIVDITSPGCNKVIFYKDVILFNEYSLLSPADIVKIINIPHSDITSSSITDFYGYDGASTSIPAISKINTYNSGFHRDVVECNEYLAGANYVDGSYDNPPLVMLKDNAIQSNSMVNYITKDFQSGWMRGDIKGAFLANSKTADRSINNNPLVETGSVTENPVRPGAELMTYSGFSSSNYLEQPYNSDLDFGTGDFYVMGWAEITTVTGFVLFRNAVASGDSGPNSFWLATYGSGTIGFKINTDVITSTEIFSDYTFITAIKKDNKMYIYGNGQLLISGDNTDNVSNSTAITRIGLSNAGILPYDGGLALLRIGAGAPSDDQIKEIYESEKHLFKENTACTLSSTTDSAVNALAYDEDTKLLYVAGTDNLDTFKGLVRTNSEVGTYTSLSAENNIVMKGN